jgi:hypothetical protein
MLNRYGEEAPEESGQAFGRPAAGGEAWQTITWRAGTADCSPRESRGCKCGRRIGIAC